MKNETCSSHSPVVGEFLENEERLRLALATGQIGMWEWNPPVPSQPKDFCPRLREILGIPANVPVTHDTFLKYVHPDDRKFVDERARDALAGANGGEYVADYRITHAQDGRQHWVTARGQVFFDAEGRAIRFLGTVMDITEQKHAQEELTRLNDDLEKRIADRTMDLEAANQALKESQNYLQLALEAIPAQVWCVLPDGTTEYQNQRWLDYAGLTKEEARGWGWKEAIHPEDTEPYLMRWQEIMAAGTMGEAEARFRRYDGEYRWFLMRVFPLKNESKETSSNGMGLIRMSRIRERRRKSSPAI